MKRSKTTLTFFETILFQFVNESKNFRFILEASMFEDPSSSLFGSLPYREDLLVPSSQSLLYMEDLVGGA